MHRALLEVALREQHNPAPWHPHARDTEDTIASGRIKHWPALDWQELTHHGCSQSALWGHFPSGSLYATVRPSGSRGVEQWREGSKDQKSKPQNYPKSPPRSVTLGLTHPGDRTSGDPWWLEKPADHTSSRDRSFCES